MNGKIPHELQGVFTVHMTDVTQSRVPSPKPIDTRPTAVSSSHDSEDPQSDNQGFYAIGDEDLGVGRSSDDFGNVGSAGLSHDSLIDGVISIRVKLLIIG